jgi:hypothetical protein
MTTTKADCLIIKATEWYRRADFIAWLNRATDPDITSFPATWHRPGDEIGGMDDVFTYYDDGDGSDCDDMPPDVWEQIHRACRQAGMVYGVVWIQNQTG